jgi:hypothetical protein
MTPLDPALRWYALTRGRPVSGPAAVDAVQLLTGAAHRRAWTGPDVHGDRDRALRWFLEATATLSADEPGLAAVLDWWQVSALGRPAVELAWSIDRAVDGPVGEVLRRVLDIDAPDGRRLDELRRPARLRRVLDELATASERNPGKISADKQILAEAMAECKAVLRAAKAQEGPPAALRLARASEAELEGWASEGAVGRHVEPGTPVWDHLLKQLALRARLVRQALGLWPQERPPAVALPPDWRETLRAVCGEGADVACALVEDVLPEPPDRPVLEPGRVLAALALPPEDPAYHLAALVLVREAVAAGASPLPSWTRAVERQTLALHDALAARGADYQGDALTALDAARTALDELDLEGAQAWLRTADDEQRLRTAGADLDRQRTRLELRAAQLRDLGQPAPDASSDLEGWEQALAQQWSLARDALQQRLETLQTRSAELEPDGAPEAPLLLGAGQALARDQLLAAHAQLDQAHSQLQQAHDAHLARLGPDLAALWDRRALLAEPATRQAVAVALHRAAARRATGLDCTALQQDLLALLSHLERGQLPAALGLPAIGRGRIRRLAWVLGAVAAEGEDSRPTRQVGEVEVTRGEPVDAPARVAGWGELVLSVPTQASGRLYLLEDEDVVGPFLVEEGEARPEHRWQAVGRLAVEAFAAHFGRIALSSGRWLVPHPPPLEEMLQAGAMLLDRLDTEAAALWLARQLHGAPSPAALAAWLEATEREALPPALHEARLTRLGALLERARALSAVRAAAVEQFLSSEEGRSRLAEALAVRVGTESEALRQAVARRRAEMEAELAALQAELEAARQQAAALEGEREARRAEAEAEREVLESLRADRKTRLLVELLGGGSARAPSEVAASAPVPVAQFQPPPPPSPAVELPLRAPPFAPTAEVELGVLLAEVAGRSWAVQDVTNLLLSMATGRWTLLAGLPGVGKSTFVRSVLSRLGHGPQTERYLELVVRRDWQDDAALLGFWHPTERLWMASSEGFVEHLLRAADDARQGHGGLWPVLVEELNLASPEYYLARPLSALEAAEPTLRLYDAQLAPRNGARYPPSLVVPDSVRIVGTVNVDDTVERLSPRFLSRASVLWVEPRAELPPWRPEDDVAVHRVPWAVLRAATARGEAELGPIAEVFRFLAAARVPGVPTARTRAAIGRYLGAARGLLPREVAEDLQVLQRVLPPLRGVGPRWRGLLDELASLLERHGWTRSAARTVELRARGEELGDWYDFFHT